MKIQPTCFERLQAAVLLALLLVSISRVPSAQAADGNPPERLTYQGFLVDANGLALATSAPKNFDVVFRIYDSQSGGTLKWAEQQTITVDKGFFSVLLGEGSANGSDAHPSLSTVFGGTDASDRFVGILVKGIGPGSPATDVDILPRLRMLTSPYSYLARNAINAANLVNSTGSPIVTLTGANVGVVGAVTAATLSGALNATNISSGKLPDGRLSANVALLNANQTFTGANTFPSLSISDGTHTLSASLGSRYSFFGNDSQHLAITAGGQDKQNLLLTTNGAVVIGSATPPSDGILSINGTTHLNDNDIYLRGGSDQNHGLGWYGGSGSTKIFPGSSLDGPVLYGYTGGGLGTSFGGKNYAMSWNFAGVCTARTLFSNASDRNLKENFKPIDAKGVLAKVTAMPITEWNYKSEGVETRHVGPVAQDFHASFNLGTDDKHISTVDEGGVALAAIKGLHEVVQEKDQEIQSLKRDLQELRGLVEKLAESKNNNR